MGIFFLRDNTFSFIQVLSILSQLLFQDNSSLCLRITNQFVRKVKIKQWNCKNVLIKLHQWKINKVVVLHWNIYTGKGLLFLSLMSYSNIVKI